ncbi:MAG: SsrA-binding protein SmpB [Phycisphaerales bacterium JB039]
MAGKRKKSQTPKRIENRRARFDYQITDTLEVGIALMGSEVKSVRDGRVSLAEGYVTASENPIALELHSVNIAEYPPAGANQHAPTRLRRLLAHKREIVRLARASQEKGVTIVPLAMYFHNGVAKLQIGLGKGRGKTDKRQVIAEREHKRDIDRAMSRKM